MVTAITRSLRMCYVSASGSVLQHTFPESTVMFSCVLGVRLGRQRLEVFRQKVRSGVRITRPRSVAVPIRIARPGKVCPGGHEFVREILLLAVERVRYS